MGRDVERLLLLFFSFFFFLGGGGRGIAFFTVNCLFSISCGLVMNTVIRQGTSHEDHKGFCSLYL